MWFKVLVETLITILPVQVRYEPAAAVGATQPERADQEQPLFPHLYGGIDLEAIIREHTVKRDSSGHFLAIEGICKA